MLTEKGVVSLRPAPSGKRYIISDALVPGLGVRVTDRGHRSFVLGARFPGSKHFVRREIGAVGAITLADARETARAWITMIRGGRDPHVFEQKKRAEAALRAANTFGSVAEDFIAGPLRGKRKAAAAEREIRKELIPLWGERPITEIERRDVTTLIEAIAKRGTTGSYARNVLDDVRAIFSWAVERSIYGLGEHSPCDRIKPKKLIGEKRIRTRVLTDDELRALWKAAQRLGYPHGSLVHGLLLCGCRANELAKARWREFDMAAQVWTIPAERFKTGQQHIVPLTPAMLEWLETLPRWKESDYLFTVDGRAPTNSFWKAKVKLVARMTAYWRALGRMSGVERDKPDYWQLHDLRRTVRTQMAMLQIPELVAELVIGHGKKGIGKVYDQHRYTEEMRKALMQWHTKLHSIVAPPPDAGRHANVVQMPKKRRR
jgi:integrase